MCKRSYTVLSTLCGGQLLLLARASDEVYHLNLAQEDGSLVLG